FNVERFSVPWRVGREAIADGDLDARVEARDARLEKAVVEVDPLDDGAAALARLVAGRRDVEDVALLDAGEAHVGAQDEDGRHAALVHVDDLGREPRGRLEPRQPARVDPPASERGDELVELLAVRL